MDLVIWMVILLGINWGGFGWLLWRTSRKESKKASEAGEIKNSSKFDTNNIF
ncbi:MAG: hypothetical protein WCC06_11390 [Candidatus Aminicenantales bacterium]